MPYTLSWAELEALSVAMNSLFYQNGVSIPDIAETSQKMLDLIEGNFGTDLKLGVIGGLYLAALSIGHARLDGESFHDLVKKKEEEVKKKEPSHSADRKHMEALAKKVAAGGDKTRVEANRNAVEAAVNGLRDRGIYVETFDVPFNREVYEVASWIAIQFKGAPKSEISDICAFANRVIDDFKESRNQRQFFLFVGALIHMCIAIIEDEKQAVQ